MIKLSQETNVKKKKHTIIDAIKKLLTNPQNNNKIK